MSQDLVWDTALQAVDGHCLVKWKPIMLVVLFGGMAPKPNSSSRTIEVDVEGEMQNMMAEALEDARLDDGTIKIGSDDKYQ